ncbi:MAG: hypothetical protein ACKO96_20355, partial [Flammeovirgaceae bacterium]
SYLNSKDIRYQAWLWYSSEEQNSNAWAFTIGLALGLKDLDKISSDRLPAPGWGYNLFSAYPENEYKSLVTDPTILPKYESLSLSTYRPVTNLGIIGASVADKIVSMYADDKFASQLVAQSLGNYGGGLVGDAIDYAFDITPKSNDSSLTLAAIYKRLPASFISTGISLGSN